MEEFESTLETADSTRSWQLGFEWIGVSPTSSHTAHIAIKYASATCSDDGAPAERWISSIESTAKLVPGFNHTRCLGVTTFQYQQNSFTVVFLKYRTQTLNEGLQASAGVTNMRKRIPIPHAYYVDLRMRLQATGTAVVEDLDQLEEENILMDFDEDGYFLQKYTKTLTDRPTVFLEIIQRNNFTDFGNSPFS